MCIRQAEARDIGRLCEIEVFNYRLNFYPIFKNDGFYFKEYTVCALSDAYCQSPGWIQNTFVFDDGCVKGFVRVSDGRIEKLFVEPVLQSNGIGKALLDYAVFKKNAKTLWALEKNARAISFYRKNGFDLTGETKAEEDTDEYLVKLILKEEYVHAHRA